MASATSTTPGTASAETPNDLPEHAVKSPVSKSPVSKSPAKDVMPKSPVKEAPKSPVKEAPKSPLKEAHKSPVKEAAPKSPLKEAAPKSPLKEVAKSLMDDTIVAGSPKSVASPKIGSPTKSPVKA